MYATVRNVSFGGLAGSHIQRIQRVPGERGTFSRDVSFRIQALAFRIQALAFRIHTSDSMGGFSDTHIWGLSWGLFVYADWLFGYTELV